MRDPYEVLGVSRDADDKKIKAAYRKLARDLHPDLHPDDEAAENKFKDVQAAYDLLKDKDKRAAFDRGEIGADGTQHYRTWTGGGPGAGYTDAGAFFRNFGGEDVFADLFRTARGGGGQTFRMRGADARYSLQLDFLDAVKGAEKHITLPDGKRLKVTIPPGSEDGQTLRLKGQGGPGSAGGPPGDALIELGVRTHPTFRRDGRDIRIDLSVTLDEAVLGAKIDVPTIDGPVAMSVPAGSNTGKTLRLKGKGIPSRGGARGDQYVTLRVVLPEPPGEDLENLVREWARSHPYSVRDDGKS